MISDVYFPRVNGVSTSIRTFRRCFLEMGNEVTLIAPDYGDNGEAGAEHDKDVIRIPSRYLMFDPEDRMMKRRPIDSLIPFLRTRDFELVHIQTPFLAHYQGIRLARLLGVPRITTFHTFFEDYFHHYLPYVPSGFLRRVTRALALRQCNSVAAVVVPSRAIEGHLRRIGVRPHIEVIPTGIPLEEFRGGDGARFRARHGISEGRPTMVTIGRVAFEKNLDFLIDVVDIIRRSLPDVLLIIAGEGPARSHVEKRVEQLELQDNVLMVGYLSRGDELLDCYRAASVFVFASRTETQGLVLLEAMALGVPVVSTAVLGTEDIVSCGRGALVARDDVQDFAAKVLSVLKSRALQLALGDAGRAFAREWSAEEKASRLLDLYATVVAKGSGTGTG
jgi:glycosyltransferase involved in cell wall biosynthesis